jgi:hypothetical protein
VVDSRVDPRAFTGDLPEQFQLVHGSSPFANQPRFGQAGFLVCTMDQSLTQSEKFIGDPFEEESTLVSGRCAILAESGVGDLQSGIHVGFTGEKNWWP